MWRLGGWTATHTFVDVTGDLRRDLFRHLTGHAPSYFADRSPGTLAGRITATANAIYTVESALRLARAAALRRGDRLDRRAVLRQPGDGAGPDRGRDRAGLASSSPRRAGRRKLHHAYAADAAAVDGELVDVINNMPLVRAFGATLRERERFAEQRAAGDDGARPQPALSREAAAVPRRCTTALLSAGLLAWAILLWRRATPARAMSCS